MNEYDTLIKESGISKTKIALALGISKGYLSDQLKGRRKFTAENELRQHLRTLSTRILNFLEK